MIGRSPSRLQLCLLADYFPLADATIVSKFAKELWRTVPQMGADKTKRLNLSGFEMRSQLARVVKDLADEQSDPDPMFTMALLSVPAPHRDRKAAQGVLANHLRSRSIRMLMFDFRTKYPVSD